MWVLQERRQAEERILGAEIAERDGGGQQFGRIAGVVACAVTGDATNLMKELLAQSDGFNIGTPLPERAGGGEKVDQRLNGLAALRLGQTGEQVRHGA